jgi:gamma-glutamylaminecyclotransferase
MPLIFVYGTLKRGGSNHAFMDGQAFVGRARTAAGYTLYLLDGYPGMVARPDRTEGVRGEVWSVDEAALVRLDELEGTAEGLYRREPVAVGEPFGTQAVEAYLFNGDLSGRTEIGSAWSLT